MASNSDWQEMHRRLLDLLQKEAKAPQVPRELFRQESFNGPINPFDFQKREPSKPPAKQKKLDVDEIADVIREARDRWCSENGEWDPGKMPVNKLAAYIAKNYTVLGEGE